MTSGYALILRGQLGPVAREVWFLRATIDELSVDLVTELMDGRSLYLLVAGGASLSLRAVGTSAPALDLRPYLTIDLGDRARITFDPSGHPRGYDPHREDPEAEGSLASAIRNDELDEVSVTMDWNEVVAPPLSTPVLAAGDGLEVDGRRLQYGPNVMTPMA